MRNAVPIVVEQTLVVLKPDAVRRGLVGEVLRRFEAKGYALVAVELREAERELLEDHYREHASKSFFASVIDYMSSGPVVAVVLSGQRVIEGVRIIVGATNPTEAAAGTIRGDFGRAWPDDAMQNIVHASDSPESALREISLWFPHLPAIDAPND